MRIPRLVIGIVILGVATAVFAQTPGPTAVPTPKPTPWLAHGPEFSAPTTTSGDQKEPDVAIGADGGTVVVWTSDGQDGDGGGIFARLFDAAGLPLAGEFQVNTSTTGDQSEPAAASDLSGNFVVIWTSTDVIGGTDLFARRYDSGGSPLSGEFQVNTYTTGFQSSPRIAMNADGFVVVWSSSPLSGQLGQDGDQGGVYGQRFSVNGVPDGAEFPVNTYYTGEQKAPSIGMDPYSGEFTVVWESRGQDGDLGGIFGQRFQASGPPNGGEFAVNEYTTGDQTRPDISGGSDSVVVWSSEGQDGSTSGVVGHAYSWILPLTSDFQVNRWTAGAQTRARVVRNESGYPPGFIVVWESFGQDDPADPSSSGIFAQRFNNSPYPTAVSFLVQPVPRGAEYQINAHTAGAQSAPAIALSADGRFVVAWESSGQDGSGESVFAKRFNFPVAVQMEVDGSAASGGSSDLDGVLEPGERVTVAPSWNNPAYPTSIALFGSADNLTGPEGPTHTIDDSNADYGTVEPYQTNDCMTATGNCYEVTVAGARPSQHWDVTFDEHPVWSSSLGIPELLTKTWALHVGGSFPDVPQDAFSPYIENLFHNGVTAGGGCGAGLYCGEDLVLRQQMAVFLLKARLGADYEPPPATGGVFADVAASDPFAPWIEELARRAITGGCTAPPPPELPSYCPTAAVNRQQMAVFLWKAYWGIDYFGPCTQVFDDVPCTNPFAQYIWYLSYNGIAAGCQANPPLYCPTDPTKRKQMAAFVVKTFGLELYGPD